MTSPYGDPFYGDPTDVDPLHVDPSSADPSHGDPPHDEPVVDPALDPSPDSAFTDPDADLFDESWQAPKRTNRLTAMLVVALLVVAGFSGGVLVQKHHDVGLAAAAAGTGARRAFGQGGGGSGGGGGGGRGQGGTSTVAPGAGGGSRGCRGRGRRRGGGGRGDAGGAGAGADTGAAPPVVVGTVRTVDDGAIEVTDPNGAVVRVFVPSTATVTTFGLAGLAFNTPVSVAGTKEVDGSVEATSVTVRRPGG